MAGTKQIRVGKIHTYIEELEERVSQYDKFKMEQNSSTLINFIEGQKAELYRVATELKELTNYEAQEKK